MLTREYTIKMLDLIDEGIVDTQALAEQLLSWLSEDDVKQFWYANGFAEALEDEEDEED